MHPYRIRRDDEHGLDLDLATAITIVREGCDARRQPVARITITRVYDTDTGEHDAGDPVPGDSIEISAAGITYGTPHGPGIAWASQRARTALEARASAELLTIAALIAEAAADLAISSCLECGAPAGVPCEITCIADQAPRPAAPASERA